MVCIGRKNDPGERPAPKVHKPLKRPALRGDVTAPGVDYDTGALSCFLFSGSFLVVPPGGVQLQLVELPLLM